MTCVVLSAVYALFYTMCANGESRVRYSLLWAFAAQLAISFFNAAIHDLYILKTVVHFAVSVAMMMLIFGTRALKSVLLVCLCFAGQLLAEVMAMSVHLALHPAVPELTGGVAINLAVCVFNAAVLLSMGVTIRSVTLEFSKKELVMVTLLSFLFFSIEFSLVQIMRSPVVFAAEDDVRAFLAVGILLCFAADTLAVRLTVSCARSRRVALQNAVLEKQCERQRAHYEDFAGYTAQVRAMRHDIANHLMTIERLVRKGEIAHAENFSKELADRYSAVSTIDYCQNSLVDAILHEKIAAAEKEGIAFAVDVRVNDTVAVDDVILSSVFCNLLDNAIEAAAAFRDKYGTGKAPVVEIEAKQMPEALVVRTRNPYIQTEKEKHLVKNDGLHGTGTVILKAAAKKYGGVYERSTADGVCTCSITMLLCAAQ